MKRKLLSALLCASMLTGLIPAAALPVRAVSESGSSASQNEIMAPTKGPDQAWQEDDTHPYGQGCDKPFALNAVNELVFYTNKPIYNKDGVKGPQVYTSDYDKGNQGTLIGGAYYGTENYINQGPANSLGYVDAGFVKGVAFDPLGTGRADHGAFIGLMDNGGGETSDIVYWVQDLRGAGRISEVRVLGPAPTHTMWEYESGNFLAITAGDYDGDGKDTVFVAMPTASAIYELAGVNGSCQLPGNPVVRSIDYNRFVLDDQRGSVGDGDETKWHAISLATGDFDRDSVDELAVSAGLAYQSNIGSDGSFDKFKQYGTTLSLFKQADGQYNVMSNVAKVPLISHDPSRDEVDNVEHLVTTRYFDSMRFAGISTGDVNGDGYDDVVAAGYLQEISESSIELQGQTGSGFSVMAWPSDTQLAFSVCYGGSLNITDVKKLNMNAYTKAGSTSEKTADIRPQVPVACAAIDGFGTPEYVFIAGTVYTVDMGGNAKEAVTAYRATSGGSSYWKWYNSVVGGNFDGNAGGREQFAAVAWEKYSDQDYDCYVDVIGGYKYSDVVGAGGEIEKFGSVQSLYTTVGDKKLSCTVWDEDSSDSPGYGAAERMSGLVLAADLDNDGVLAKYVTKSFGYSDAQVQAVLQAAPYFGELGDYDEDFSDGATTYSFSNGFTDVESWGDSVNVGLGFVTEHEFKVYRFSLGIGVDYAWTQTFEEAHSVEYTSEFSASGDDSVVLYRIPETTYYYAMWDPVSGTYKYDEKNIMAVVIPQAPTYTVMDKESYNTFADEYNKKYAEPISKNKAQALPKVTATVLPENATGDPFAYRLDAGAPPIVEGTTGRLTGFTSLAENKKELGTGSSSVSSGWTSSEEYSEGTEHDVGFHVSTTQAWGWTGTGGHSHTAGFEVDFAYSHAMGTMHTDMKSKGVTGTVNSLDQNAMLRNYGVPLDVTSQYGFTWDFGKWDWVLEEGLNGEKKGTQIPVYGYVLSNVRAAAPVPRNLTASAEALGAVELAWEPPVYHVDRPYDGYRVWYSAEGEDYRQATTQPLAPDATGYLVEGLDSNTQYRFAVTTDRGGRNSSYSQPAFATTPKTVYTVSYQAPHASVALSSLGNNKLNNGDSVPEESLVFVQITPDEGYTVTGVTRRVNGVSTPVSTADGSFNFVLRGSTLLEVTTAPKVYDSTLNLPTPSVGGGFRTSVDGVPVTGGSAQVQSPATMVAQPQPGYVLKHWLVDGEPVAANGSNVLEFTPHKSEHEITAVFVPESDPSVRTQVTVAETVGGRLQITDAQGVELTPVDGVLDLLRGTELTVTAVPDPYFTLKNWTGALNEQSRNQRTVTVTAVEPMTVGAEFYAPVKYQVSFSASEGGTLAARLGDTLLTGTKASVQPGSTLEFTAQAEDGYRVKGWEITTADGTERLLADSFKTSDTYLLENVTRTTSVRALFTRPVKFTVTYLPGETGGTSKVLPPVDEFTELTLAQGDLFPAPKGKTFNGWKLGDKTLAAGDKLVISADTELTALWKSAGGGGIVVPPQPPVEPELPEQPENPFTDVKETDYFFDPVLWAVERKITAGISDTLFGPDLPCTRAQIVTFLWNAAGKPEPAAEAAFADVAEDDWFSTAVSWAAEKGITAGISDTEFGPDLTCTRAQAMTFLWKYLSRPEGRTDMPFTDVTGNDWFYGSVEWAVANGVTSGTSGTTFGSDDDCTRAQIVTFLYRAMNK